MARKRVEGLLRSKSIEKDNAREEGPSRSSRVGLQFLLTVHGNEVLDNHLKGSILGGGVISHIHKPIINKSSVE
ncbi:hypothetical protein PR202_gb06479 [Eleusine coracana subsp. coracana]|uniref:Histone H2A n=1 Tax=Eleusine coracana subsp. coracana TaxID=191504 RepID=A0AAV5E9S0_ELECO|nr:hypothetical protein PR202_gb06479 [Eleusine coracana subsp. coracana]